MHVTATTRSRNSETADELGTAAVFTCIVGHRQINIAHEEFMIPCRPAKDKFWDKAKDPLLFSAQHDPHKHGCPGSRS